MHFKLLLATVLLFMIIQDAFGKKPVGVTHKITSNEDSIKIEMLIREIDDLKELAKEHKIREEYFTSILDEQVQRFSLIVGGIVFLFGLLTFGNIRYEISRNTREIDERISVINAKYEEKLKKLDAMESKLFSVTANTFKLISHLCKTNGEKIYAFAYSMCVLENLVFRLNCKLDEKETKSVKELFGINLQLSEKLLKSIPIDYQHTENTKEADEIIISAFQTLVSLKDNETQNRIAKLRSTYLTLIEKLGS
jgi:hypothetical protein